MSTLPWQIRNLHPTQHSDPRKRVRRRWSQILLHALWGMQLGINVLLLRNLFTVWRGAESSDSGTSEKEAEWRETRKKLRARWASCAVVMMITGSVTVVEMVMKAWNAEKLWCVVLWTTLGKAALRGWLLLGAFKVWQERERVRKMATEAYWERIWEDPRMSLETKNSLLQPAKVVQSKVCDVWLRRWVDWILADAEQALDIYPRGIDQWIWTALAFPTFVALLPAARITYVQWRMAQQRRECKGTAVMGPAAWAEGLDGATELTVFLDPRDSRQLDEGKGLVETSLGQIRTTTLQVDSLMSGFVVKITVESELEAIRAAQLLVTARSRCQDRLFNCLCVGVLYVVLTASTGDLGWRSLLQQDQRSGVKYGHSSGS
nr:hypothetical protein CFP56_21137 [Quercus suber]